MKKNDEDLKCAGFRVKNFEIIIHFMMDKMR